MRYLKMTIGKPLRCYPFKRKDGTFMYLPYDKTEFDLTFKGGEKELKLINEYWEAIGKPKYNPRKSVQENLTDLKKYMGYWPEPMDCDKVVQTTLSEYEEDDEESNEAIQDYFKMQQDFQLKQEEPKKRKKNYKKDWDDDDVPF